MVTINNERGVKLTVFSIPENIWERISFVDYIMIDNDHKLHSDFNDHTETTRTNMQYIIDRCREGALTFDENQLQRPEMTSARMAKAERDLMGLE